MSNGLPDMKAQSHENHEIKYQLHLIDIFSRYVWVISIHDKSVGSMTETLKELFIRATQRGPHWLETDKGWDLLITHLQRFLSSHAVQ